MRIHWEDKAEWNLHQIEDYIFERFGPDSLEKFMDRVDQSVETILRYPNIGPVEPLLADLPQSYHSVVVGNLSKIVYRVEDEVIYIADIWDCRREPKAMAGEVKSGAKEIETINNKHNV